MPTFAYSGRTRAGQTVNGERAADTMDAAVAALRRDQILVTRITPAAKAEAEPKKGKAGKLGKKVSAKNLAVFTRQFSVMIDAGLPLVQCLDILGRQEPNKHFSAVILKVREDVEAGAALADQVADGRLPLHAQLGLEHLDRLAKLPELVGSQKALDRIGLFDGVPQLGISGYVDQLVRPSKLEVHQGILAQQPGRMPSIVRRGGPGSRQQQQDDDGKPRDG